MAADISMTFGKTVGPGWVASGNLKGLDDFDPDRDVAYEVVGVANALIDMGYMEYEHGRDDTRWNLMIASAFNQFVDAILLTCPLSDVPAIEVSPDLRYVKIDGWTKCPALGNAAGTYDEFNFNGEPWMQLLDRNNRIQVIGVGRVGSEAAWYTEPAREQPPAARAEAGMLGAWPWLLGAGAVVGLIYWGSRD